MTTTTFDEFVRHLIRLGPTYYGSNEAQAREIADEWLTVFSADSACDWLAEGFWCPYTAHQLSEAGYRPGQLRKLADEHQAEDPDAYDLVYRLCNNDADMTTIEDLLKAEA